VCVCIYIKNKNALLIINWNRKSKSLALSRIKPNQMLVLLDFLVLSCRCTKLK